MLKSTRWFFPALAGLLLTACGQPKGPAEPPMSVEATYRLLFNDVLVGNALFTLKVAEDGSYRLEAFTIPAGQMDRAAGHEVLETSEGLIAEGGIRPLRFEHSVMQDGQIELVELRFDWEQHALQVSGKDGQREIALLPDTHDRLSYLLAARRLAAAGSGMQQLQVASPEASEDTRLEVVGRAAIEVPFGHYDAVGIHRITPDSEEGRMLWFDTKFGPLPLRVVHLRDGSTVEMQLEGFSRRPSDPR